MTKNVEHTHGGAIMANASIRQIAAMASSTVQTSPMKTLRIAYRINVRNSPIVACMADASAAMLNAMVKMNVPMDRMK